MRVEATILKITAKLFRGIQLNSNKYTTSFSFKKKIKYYASKLQILLTAQNFMFLFTFVYF